ncbi:RNA polymerase sigma factor [Orlajensenia leifsoniae]|uniref:RNA polymerase sigma factor n=1 Tax=Orlajensenia leifsoniae TaxID=2561933 RepID=A0A4Y9R8Y6_9MICO|nr:RNA polymerase sigma factor [Leifsonia flava]TFW00044.1 RNA polymerase sigma factor [Leifsonia flava]
MTTETGATDAAGIRRSVAAVWRMESARIVATLTRVTGDFSLAEDLAQEALADALEQWPRDGIPRNAGAWLTAVAKRKAIDGWRRRERLDDRYSAIAHDLESRIDPDAAPWDPDDIDDDVLRLVFIACHPVLAREARVALTLRVVGGLSSEEIARAFLVPTATVQQRIVRAKKSLAAAKVQFEVPSRDEYAARLGSVLGVIYLVFNEGYAASSGTEWMRPELSQEALRLGRVLAELAPREPEVHGLVALMEFQTSRFRARVTAEGEPILLGDQDRSRWDRAQIIRGRTALARADAVGRGRGAYALQAAIAECHSVAPSTDETDWDRIVVLYEVLGRLAPSPIVDLNRAVAVAMATGPATGLRLVDEIAASGALSGTHLLPSVRGELLARLGRLDEARVELSEAARLTGNERERGVLLGKVAALGPPDA